MAPTLIALACFAAAPPAAMPAEWRALVRRLDSADHATRRKALDALSALGEEATPLLRRAVRPGMDVDTKLALYAACAAIRERHWGLVRAFGPGAPVTTVGHGYWFNRVRFSRDGKYAVVGGGGLILYDLATGKEVGRVLEFGGARPGLDVSRDGKFALTGHAANTSVHLVELPSLKTAKTLNGHEGGSEKGIRGVCLSPDGNLAASVAGDDALIIWDVKKGGAARRIALRGSPATRLNAPLFVAFSPDGKRVLVGHPGSAEWPLRLGLYEVATGKLAAMLTHKAGTATSAAFFPDGKRVIASTTSGKAVVLSVTGGKELLRLGHGIYASAVALSPDGGRAATVGYHDRLVRVWDLRTGKLLETFAGHMSPVLWADFSPDGKRLLTCDAIAAVRLWKVGRR